MPFSQTFYLVSLSLLLTCCPTLFGSNSLIDSNPVDVPVQILTTSETDSELDVVISVNCLNRTEVMIDSDRFDILTIDSEPTMGKEGWPDIPFIARSILVPPGGEVSLDVVNLESRTVGGLEPVIATRYIDLSEMVSKMDGIPPGADGAVRFEGLISGVPDEDYLQCEGLWPPESVVVGETAILRGYRVMNFRFYPVQYNRSTGETVFNNNLSLRFNFEGAAHLNHPLSNPALSSIFAHRAVEKLVLNPPEAPSRDDLLSASYLYIIPDVEGVAEALQPLIDWRERQGHKVSQVYVENNCQRVDVISAIDDAYQSENPVEFVAIVGNASRSEFNIPAATATGDYEYACPDGNDPLPDVALGRISVADLEQLDRVVNKLVSYESAPFMQNTDWYKQGCVVAGSNINGLSTVLVAKYVRRELLNLGFTDVRSWYHTEQGNIGGNQQFLTDAVDWGISVLHYRAYMNMNGLATDVIFNMPNRMGRWPAVLAISCATGEFVSRESHSEAFLRSRGGGIGAIGTSTAGTLVQYNNMMSGGVWKGIYKDGLYAFGWGLNSGKYELWRAYEGFNDNYMEFMDWNNLMGDPGTIIWTDIPRAMEVNYPAQIGTGMNLFRVDVVDPDDDQALTDAMVCIYKRNDLHLAQYTNQNGSVEFYIDPAALSEGQMLVTVTRHNMLPHLGETEVVEMEYYIGVDEWTIDDDNEGESSGNEDGILNPGEQIELTLNLSNLGTEVPDGDLIVAASVNSDWIDLDAREIEFNQAPGVGESVLYQVVLGVDPACPDYTEFSIHVDVINGETEWSSQARLTVESPEITAGAINFIGGDFGPNVTRDMDIEILNTGHQNLTPFHAEIWTDSEVLNIGENEAEYAALGVGEAGYAVEVAFRITGQSFAIPGMHQDIKLAIETEEGFRDTTVIDITIGSAGDNDPFGPDEYGYVCYDSYDEGWEVTPEYEWVEINPDEEGFQYRGQDVGIEDGADNQDMSICIEMPFVFQYYGEVFEEITICSNGWAAFGNQEELADFRNRHIAQALGPNAQLCVWWDNLITRDNSAILTYHDQQQGRFIIEWSNMRRLVQGGGGEDETFQIILYDTNIRPTPTGDGIITFQYKDVTNQNAAARNDTPFCTIGISNLDDSDGLEYTYWDTYPPGASVIESEMAITFTTATSFVTGVIEGYVKDAADNHPIAGATVTASRGFRVMTNDTGFYQSDVLIGEGYEITASIDGYNDSTRVGFDVAEDETLQVDFFLKHGEFALSEHEINSELGQGERTEIPLQVINNGNGVMNWECERIYGEGECGINQLIGDKLVGPEVEDLDLHGVAFAYNRFFVTGENGNEPNTVYVFDTEGNHIDQFDQPGNSGDGMLDLTWDGMLLWGSGERTVYGFDTEGSVMSSFEGPHNNNLAIAWDSDRNYFWISSAQYNRPIIAVDRNGDMIGGAALNSCRFDITGMAYWPEDPEGYNLYVLHNPGSGRQVVHRINPETDDTLFVKELDPEYGGQPCGAFITNELEPFGWLFIDLINDQMNQRGDRIDLWQMGTYTGWMTLDNYEGVLGPESQHEFTLTLNATGLLPASYQGVLCFSHSALGHADSIFVNLEVNDLYAANTDPILPVDFKINTAYPNPFNASITVEYSLDIRGMVTLKVYDLSGRLVELSEKFHPAGGFYTRTVDAGKWGSGVYFLELENSARTVSTKLICIK